MTFSHFDFTRNDTKINYFLIKDNFEFIVWNQRLYDNLQVGDSVTVILVDGKEKNGKVTKKTKPTFKFYDKYGNRRVGLGEFDIHLDIEIE